MGERKTRKTGRGAGFGALSILAAMLPLAGCSQSVSPVSGSWYRDPSFVRAAPPAPAGTAEQTYTLSVDGKAGATLSLGRFTLIVPPGAFDGVGSVSVHIPDSTLLACELELVGLSVTHFNVPVQLTANLSGLVTDGEKDDLGILWYDESTGLWWVVSKGAKGSGQGLHISAELDHFSTYGVARTGKAGW